LIVYTETRVFRATRDEVFEYLADIDNLPEWASEFARELKLVDGRHVVVNGLGELFFEIHADRERGIVDMLAGPAPDALALFPVRIVEAPGGSVLTFTMVQQPGQPDEQFEGQHESLLRELANLERRFG
jgi:hypothetical protein